MKELQTQYKALVVDIEGIDKHLGEISGKRLKHEKRYFEHLSEVEEAERKLSDVIEKLARDNASEKELDRAQAAVDSLKNKGASLAKILEVVTGDMGSILQLKDKKEKELLMVRDKITRKVSESMVESLKGSLVDVYAIHRVHWLKSGLYMAGFRDFMNLLSQNIFVDDTSARTRGEEILSKFLP